MGNVSEHAAQVGQGAGIEALAADAGARIGRVMTVDSSPFFPALISPQATTADVEPLAQVAYQALQFLGDEVLLARITRRSAGSLGLQPGTAVFAVLKAVSVGPENIGRGSGAA